jgi:cell division septum initiation protein DivIVA
MDVLVLIDKLDDLVHNAKQVPLTDQVRVDKEEIYDILDQMRATIPEEIKQARWIVKERQEMLAEAKREAERIIREAREEQIRLIGEEEIVKQAERQADEIIEDARARDLGRVRDADEAELGVVRAGRVEVDVPHVEDAVQDSLLVVHVLDSLQPRLLHLLPALPRR